MTSKVVTLILLFFTAVSLAVLLAHVGNLCAQATPKANPLNPVAPETKKLPQLSTEAQKDILIDYETALLAQQASEAAKQTANATGQTYLATCEREVKAAGFPDGTKCKPDIGTKSVVPLTPNAPAPPGKK